MALQKSKIAFWGIIFIILAMVAAIFVPMSMMRGTMADTVTQLNERYNEDFIMAWSDIDDRPMSDTFTAVMQSNNTGNTYDAKITDGEAVIDYEGENENVLVNTFVEQVLPTSYALANKENEQLALNLLVTQDATEEQLGMLATQLKAEFQLTTVTIDTYLISEESFTVAQDQINNYFQRSSLPAEAFDRFDPVHKQFNF